VGFVVDKVALGQVFSEYFGFPYRIQVSSQMMVVLLNRLAPYLGATWDKQP
jgi:hypothetical protein